MTLRTDINSQSDQNLECRWPNHAWKFLRWYPMGRVDVFIHSCHCGATATDTLNRDGSLAKPRRINYAGTDAYVLKGYGRVGKDPFRRERVTRLKGRFEATRNGDTP